MTALEGITFALIWWLSVLTTDAGSTFIAYKSADLVFLLPKLELEKLRKETDLLVSKKEVLDSAKRMEELYSEALDAMKRYGGHYNDER